MSIKTLDPMLAELKGRQHSFAACLAHLALWGVILVALQLSGCASVGKIGNQSIPENAHPATGYTLANHARSRPNGDTAIFLAFSGGGSRAAALAYGVLQELNETHFPNHGKQMRLLDEVDQISSVSGGSFTAAYYGLFGDQIFDDFKQVFLYKDVQSELSNLVFGFMRMVQRMFTVVSRTEVAIDYYDKYIFRGKTFADMQHVVDRPFILINATDLAVRSQFIFFQPQFDVLCSDLSSLKVSRAVAASSAVPVLFDPVLMKNYHDCYTKKPAWLSETEKRAKRTDNSRLMQAADAMNRYLDKDAPAYATLVDGGVTDNLGLRTVLRTVGFAGEAKDVIKQLYPHKRPKRFVIIVVDASTSAETDIGKSKKSPSIADTLSVVTDIQLHLYNTETDELLKRRLKEWAGQVSTPEHPVESYFIEINSQGLQKKKRNFFNTVPTSFSLKKDQADWLIETAATLMRENKEYQRLLHDLHAQARPLDDQAEIPSSGLSKAE
ncbi:MAG: patatin-like phospholipase family protein [gamma proteobacterium symbiont of Bathyaustriella thionipta]|nr:patatin-like phospholipase family protein [gamma proteobacterium symbiont of Bathyaustriella thionipta]